MNTSPAPGAAASSSAGSSGARSGAQSAVPPTAFAGSPTASCAASSAGSSDPLPPPRLAYDPVTWREVGYLLMNLPVGIVGFVYVVVMLAVGLGLAVTVVGLPLLAAGLIGCRKLGAAERKRARDLLGVHVDEPRPLRLETLGLLPWLRATLKDPVSWRHALYFGMRFPWGIATFVLTLNALIIAWPVLPFLARALTTVDLAMVRWLLQPSDELERRIAELESDRGVVVDTAAADLRRIERDLHDGAQARLVALAMGLGLAKEKLLEDPAVGAAMVEEAHGEVKIALQELRDLARGIHPAILTDRGLDAALSSVASRCAVPVAVTVDLPARPAPAIEGIAYFTVSELLQNVSKHSGGSRASVDVWQVGDRLMLHVCDNGRGGASLAGGSGSGLAGLAERLDSVDGVLAVESPPGGPTRITAELPWRA
jgi:signal transduction histidine kinase